MEKLLLTSDLDRTIVPNGEQPESPQARPLLRKLVARPEVILAYVSGRNIDLLKQAIAKYKLPVPDYAIGDVGTTVYKVGPQQQWESLPGWEDTIAPDWQGRGWGEVKALFDGIADIRLQDDSPAYQNTFKVSYYTAPDVDRNALLSSMQRETDAANLRVALMWSVDESRKVGLLDVLPESATKLHAIQWLRESLGFSEERTVFAGDSGNDMSALTSHLRAVAVKNARQDVKDEAKMQVEKLGFPGCLYIAKGDFLGMNGNYSAGVLEGVAHYFPEVKQYLV